MGGVGKTRLAIEVARIAAVDRTAAFIPLGAVVDVDRALRTIAEQIGARAEGAREPLEVIIDHIRGHPMLLVLDNLEQIPGIAATVADLLESAPALQILATSRRALRIRAEEVVTVQPLRLPEEPQSSFSSADEPAVRLFLDRASAVAPIEVTSETVASIVDICRRLEGIPLAIELAAARTRVLSLDQLLVRLADRLSLLVGGGPDVPERQRTVRATIDWSYGLLDTDEQLLLARLSAFSGGWTVEAAEAVCGEHIDVIEGLAALLDGSLVTSIRDGAGPPRFTMLETVRGYAAERLEDAGQRSALAARHLEYYLDLGDQAQPSLCGPGQRDWVTCLGPERPNLRRAVTTGLETGRYSDIVELAWDVVVLYFVCDAVDEPASWLKEVAQRRAALDDVTAAKLRSLHALARIHHGDYDGALPDLEEPLAVFEREGMEFETAVTLHQIGFVRYRVSFDIDGAISALRESSKLFEALGHDWGVALVEAMLGSVLAVGGDLEGAEQSEQLSLGRAQSIENGPQIVQALHQLAFIRLIQQREGEAFDLLRDSTALLHAEHLRTDATYCLDALGLIALAGGDDTTATGAVTVAAAERTRLGVAPWPTLESSIDGSVRTARDRLGQAEFDKREGEAGDRDLFEALDTTIAAVAQLDLR